MRVGLKRPSPQAKLFVVRMASLALVVSALFGAGLAHAQCATVGATCDDGNYCTTGDTCNASLECIPSGTRSCADGDLCTDDTCNESADRCEHSPAAAGTTCFDGQFCTMGDTCDGAGNCTSGSPRSCDDGHDCTTDSCDEMADTCVNDLDPGACLIRGDCYVEGDFDPRTMNPCDQCIPSRSANRFLQAETGTVCGPGACSGGVFTSESICDTTGTCVTGTTAPCDSGVCADVTACVGCLADGDCAPDEYCSGTGCAAKLDVGESCLRDTACTSGECADGVCCSGVCDGPCLSCAMMGMAGTCVAYAAGTDPEAGCGAMGCDGTGACIDEPMADASVDSSIDASIPVDGGDATVGPDGSEGNGLTAHGSGCVACAVGATDERRVPALLALGAVFAALGFRRRRR